jgi:hypothetical protein
MKKKIAGHQPRSPMLNPSKIAMGDKIMKANLTKQIYLNGPKNDPMQRETQWCNQIELLRK